ncbi:uroporphyrinogen decarboxylase family protein [Anaeropeptidivorans aminofermentans]|uniref:uroporphyrinogen decarboxylase family protein n=1 Tax=Anaeropeptidivorans aminofermentans TaxID=2934315 RepID=UPI00202558AC|nr:uroporphyrinogen decarboxylase family protein [Anaeropeptidivorans aminofermentans]
MIDRMTPSQRAAAIAKGESADRLPCNPNVANGVARVYGCKISEFNTDAKTLAKAQIASYRKFGYDSIRIFTDLFPWAEAMGATVVKPDDNTVDLDKPAISDEKEISRLMPANPYKDGRLPIQLDAMKYLVDEVGSEIGCSFGVVGPFTNAFFLLGVEKTLTCIRKNPEAIHELCKISLETVKAYTEAGIKIGLTPSISEPMSSCTVVSPKVFKEFSLPYLKELVEFIKEKGKGVIIHICGQTNKIWPDLAEMGIAGMSIDNVASLTECKNIIGDKTKILGNVDPGGIMYSGTPFDVRLKTLECIQEGYDNPKGYVVMSGCSLPVDSPFDNIKEMMDTVRDVGYPVNINKVEAMIADCKKKII